MPKKKKNRLNKRQEEYLKQYGIFINAKEDDPEYESKLKVAEALDELNKKLDELNQGPEGQQKKLSIDEIYQIVHLYVKVIDAIDSCSGGLQKVIEDDKTKNKDIYRNTIDQNTVLAGLLGKDLSAFEKTAKELEGNKQADYTLDDIFEKSRVRSDYKMDPDQIIKKTAGALNERIPLTLTVGEGENAKTVKGYFTPDNKVLSGKEMLNNAVKKTQEKYGKSANFLNANVLSQIDDQFCMLGDLYADICLRKEKMLFMPYKDVMNKLFKEARVDKNIRKYMDTPEKLKIVLDAVSEYGKAGNAAGINQKVGIDAGRNINRRNSAMSSVAEMLGVPELIAHSENVSLKLDGKNETKGTFMLEAVGNDVNVASADSPFAELGYGAVDGLNLKKQLADLQVLDYICGNPDRHGGNMFYKLGKNKKGETIVEGIQGIDNDTSFGKGKFKSLQLHRITPDMMNVITKEMADRILNMSPDKLKQVLYGKKLSKEEIEKSVERFSDLKQKIITDQAEYAKGYSKGYLIPGKIKIVDDEELSQLRTREDLAKVKNSNIPNLFGRLSTFASTKAKVNEIEKTFENKYNSKAYDATLGCLGDLNKIIDKMQQDKGGLLGSSSKYDDMLDKMNKLKKNLVNIGGLLIGNNVDISKDHVKELTNFKKQLQETFEAVGVYREYKMGKKSGEEWQYDNSEHVPSRTERRYHHTMDAMRLLMKSMEAFEELDKIRENYSTFESKKEKLLSDGEARKTEYKNTKGLEMNNQAEKNFRENNLNRCEYQITEAYEQLQRNKADNIKKEDNGKVQNPADAKQERQKKHAEYEELELQYNVMLGLSLNTIEPEERKGFIDRISKKLGVKIKSDPDELIKTAVASSMILSKCVLSRKDKDDLTGHEELALGHMEKIDVRSPKKAMTDMLNSPAFVKTFNDKKKLMFGGPKMNKKPGVEGISMMHTMIFADQYKDETKRLQNQAQKNMGLNQMKK